MSAGLIKSTVFPNIEGESIIVNLKFEPGSSEEKTKKWIDHIENKIVQKNQEISEEFNNGNSLIKAIEKAIGSNQVTDQWSMATAQSSEKSYLNIILTPSEERSIGTSEITNLYK